MGGKHRKKVPVARRLAAFGLSLSAIVTLLIAFLAQPVAVSSSAETPARLQIDESTSVSQPTPTPSSAAKTKIKRTQRSARQALSAPLPKIEKDQAVTPEDPPSIKSERTSAPPLREDLVKSSTPTAGKVRSSAQRQVISKTITPPKTKESVSKPSVVSKASLNAAEKITPTARVVTTPSRVSVSPKPKPQTVKAPPPSVPKLTTNSKCSNIGLLPAPKAACNQILAAFPELKSVLGVGGRAGNPNSCHPKGLAIDLIVGSNKALGDRLYAYVIARRSALGATPVVLWQVADHFDHVHVSFSPCKG